MCLKAQKKKIIRSQHKRIFTSDVDKLVHDKCFFFFCPPEESHPVSEDVAALELSRRYATYLSRHLKTLNITNMLVTFKTYIFGVIGFKVGFEK